MESLVAYAGHQGDGSVHSCAVVNDLGFRDLTACLPMTESWHRRGIAVPLLLSSDELRRTVDIFPLEYASIVADHVLVRGRDPFAGLAIPVEDLRRGVRGAGQEPPDPPARGLPRDARRDDAHRAGGRRIGGAAACAAHAHLEAPDHGTGQAETSTPTDASLAKLAQLRMGVPETLIREVLASSSDGQSTISDPSHLLGRYIEASRKIWEYVDRWRS